MHSAKITERERGGKTKQMDKSDRRRVFDLGLGEIVRYGDVFGCLVRVTAEEARQGR